MFDIASNSMITLEFEYQVKHCIVENWQNVYKSYFLHRKHECYALQK